MRPFRFAPARAASDRKLIQLQFTTLTHTRTHILEHSIRGEYIVTRLPKPAEKLMSEKVFYNSPGSFVRVVAET